MSERITNFFLPVTVEVVGSIWLAGLLSIGLISVGACAGWSLGRARAVLPVRIVTWWLRRVVVPLLHKRSWFVRFSSIFANNITILAVLTWLGRWQATGLIGVAAVGISLGVGLRILGEEFPDFSGPGTPEYDIRRWRVRIGMALNMLELPAIMLSGGLAVQRSALSLETAAVWGTFVLWILPAALAGAAGEALWLGARHSAGSAQSPSLDETFDPRNGSNQ